MRRGEVWWVNFVQAVGGEVRKQRPAAIVSNDVSNRFLNRLQVVPLTTSVDHLYPSEAYVDLDRRQHKAMADQLTSVSKTRLRDVAGRLSGADISEVERAVKVQLGLSWAVVPLTLSSDLSTLNLSGNESRRVGTSSYPSNVDEPPDMPTLHRLTPLEH